MCGKNLATPNYIFVDYFLIAAWVLSEPMWGYLHFYLDVLVIGLIKNLEENIWLIGIILVKNEFSYTKLLIS